MAEVGGQALPQPDRVPVGVAVQAQGGAGDGVGQRLGQGR